MLFTLSKLVEIVLQPGNFLVLLLTAGVLLFALGMRRWGAGIVVLVTLCGLAIMVLPVGDLVVSPLERRFPRPELPQRIDGIILLGGAVDLGLTIANGQVALNGMAERLTETLALAHRYPDAKVLISGGNGELEPKGLSEADATSSVLVADGLEPRRIIIEGRARNTYENAIYSKAVAQPRADQIWVLVTSANHIPRAVGCFRQAGWEVIPYPVDYTSGPAGIGVDFDGGLRVLNDALHEWIGLVVYRLLGRTDALLPAPSAIAPRRAPS